MAQTFQQLLKEFPKSSVASQAHYYIGKAAFDAKDYKRAMPSLDTARRLNRAQCCNLASLRMVLADYDLRDRKAATAEVDEIGRASCRERVSGVVVEWSVV